MTDKINLAPIIKDHFNTLRKYPTKKRRKRDYVFFFILPAGVAAALTHYYGALPTNLIPIITTSLSVSIALLLNLFVLTYNTIMNSDPPTITDINTGEKGIPLIKKFGLEITSNIGFSIIIALTILACTLFFGISHDTITPAYQTIITGAIYYFGIMFGLKILMLLTRLYVLLREGLYGIKQPEKSEPAPRNPTESTTPQDDLQITP